ncbi:putative tRNA sulfurtransferase [Candidatus Calditenuaceae archaeon HR02]|nr:putative tRNA sulfurtransferase [Candidatus Calditenuaceae archaeon HR02]
MGAKMAESPRRPAIIVAASEIMLKGGNRPRYERLLARNIADAVSGRGAKVYRRQARIIVEPGGSEDAEELALRISRIPGVRWVRIGYLIPRDYDLLMQIAVEKAREIGPSRVAVEVSRADKSYPKTSLEIARELGERILSTSGAVIDLKSPETIFWVSVLDDAFLFGWRRIEGVGGLPVGASGRVLALLSGGLDSPVAAWLMMKRGCIVDMLHIYAPPTPQEALSEKIGELFLKLKETSPSSRLFLAPYHHFLSNTLSSKARLELALFRRFMLRLAEALSLEIGAKAIVTGDSVGQVASQTLESLHAASYGLRLVVLRPLAGYDKEEIIRLSKTLGFYELSIKSYKDCCSIVSRHPVPRPRLEDVEEEWRRLGLDDSVAKTLGEVYVFDGARLEAWKTISTGRQEISQE